MKMNGMDEKKLFAFGHCIPIHYVSLFSLLLLPLLLQCFFCGCSTDTRWVQCFSINRVRNARTPILKCYFQIIYINLKKRIFHYYQVFRVLRVEITGAKQKQKLTVRAVNKQKPNKSFVFIRAKLQYKHAHQFSFGIHCWVFRSVLFKFNRKKRTEKDRNGWARGDWEKKTFRKCFEKLKYIDKWLVQLRRQCWKKLRCRHLKIKQTHTARIPDVCAKSEQEKFHRMGNAK